LGILELIAYRQGGLASLVASRLWVAHGGLYFGLSVWLVSRVIRDDFRCRFAGGALALILLSGVAFWRLGSFDYHLNGEAAHEVCDGLARAARPDWGYTTSAFLGYPSRQYLIAALPTQVLGRSVLALRLSYTIPFVSGAFVFYAGLRRFLPATPNGRRIAALAVGGVLTFPYVTLLLRDPEQVLIPISLALHACGWFLAFLASHGLASAVALSWVGAMLGTSYTPSLAAWLLLAALMTIVAFSSAWVRDRRTTILAVGVIVLSMVFGAASFHTREDIVLRLHQQGRGGPEQVMPQLQDAYEIFFMLSNRTLFNQPFMSRAAAPAVYAWLLLSTLFLTGRARVVQATVAVWVLATVGVSVYARGYAPAEAEHDMWRAMVVIPPMLAGMAVCLSGLLERAGRTLGRWTFIWIFAIFATTVALNLRSSQEFWDARERRAMWLLDDAVQTGRDAGMGTHRLAFAIYSSKTDFNLFDYLAYFFPGYHGLRNQPDRCAGVFETGRTWIVYFEQDEDVCRADRNWIRAAPGIRKGVLAATAWGGAMERFVWAGSP
jgi:hypothetical protein